MSARGDMRKIVKAAIKRGWRNIGKEQNRKTVHYIFEWTDGTRVTASVTPSCDHAVKNFIADMRRAERSVVDKGSD